MYVCMVYDVSYIHLMYPSVMFKIMFWHTLSSQPFKATPWESLRNRDMEWRRCDQKVAILNGCKSDNLPLYVRVNANTNKYALHIIIIESTTRKVGGAGTHKCSTYNTRHSYLSTSTTTTTTTISFMILSYVSVC